MSRFKGKKLYISSGDMSGNLTGGTIDMNQESILSAIYTVSSASSLNGTIQIQVSNDDSTWVDSSSTATLTADGSGLLNLADIGSKYARVTWTNSAGSGTLVVDFHAKE